MDKKPSENKEGENIEETLPNTRNRNEDGNLVQILSTAINSNNIYSNIHENPNDIMVILRKNKENGLKEIFLCEKIEDKLLITDIKQFKIFDNKNTKIARELFDLFDKENEEKKNIEDIFVKKNE